MWALSTLPWAQGPHVGKSAVCERSSYILGGVQRPGAYYEIAGFIVPFVVLFRWAKFYVMLRIAYCPGIGFIGRKFCRNNYQGGARFGAPFGPFSSNSSSDLYKPI